MRRLISLVFPVASALIGQAQTDPPTVSALLTNVFAAQGRLEAASYEVTRTDTFTSGETRQVKGQASLMRLPADTVFGFAFNAKQDNVDANTLYDGKTCFYLDHEAKEYSLDTDPRSIPHKLGAPGGQVILKCLYHLDTSRAVSLSVNEDVDNYYLLMTLPDITEYNVIKRWHRYRIDKKTWLPVGVREHQETEGHVQDVNYQITQLRLGVDASAWRPAGEIIPAGYHPEADRVNTKLLAMKGKPLPSFLLPLFDSSAQVGADVKGQVVLLDFWEVWCGPCVASMPKVQALYDRHRPAGLRVYGIMSEPGSLDAAKALVARRNVTFPNLVSNPEVNGRFAVQAVPTYILADRKGVVRFTSEGFSDELSTKIEALLREK